tara:strand:+ start:16456 stop:16947 length:492 start_codon:yes stop_codon:yes gene_type:complete
MFVCSPVSPEWVPFAFSTPLGILEGSTDSKTGIIGSLGFTDAEIPEGPANQEGGSLLEFLIRLRPLRLPIAEQPFFQRVYEELSEVPAGQTITYKALAERAGRPSAARAVGQAVARNPICLLIPCHRVLPCRGDVGNFRWGVERKKALLDLEKNGQDAWEVLG